MSPHGDVQPSCTTVPLGKSMRRAFRAAVGMPKPKKKKRPGDAPAPAPGGVPMEMVSSSSLAAARKEAVVRVVLRGGVVEVYPGVVLACTVIRNHPPGLCLAHPDVFRNPHGAVVRPLEPLFPGQKFLLVPWTTIVKLKQKIPESSVGAIADGGGYEDEDEDEDEGTGSEEATSTDTEPEAAGDGGSVAAACSARAYFEDRDEWSECRFKNLVKMGLAVEPRKDEPERKDRSTRKKGKKKKRAKRRERRPVPVSAVGLRTLATPRRTWEPSLPAVEEEEGISPLPPRPTPEPEEEDIRPDDHREP